MSEEQTSNQQVIVIGLAVIAVLLAAIVGVLVWQQAQATSIPAPTAQQQAPAQAADSAGAMGGAMGGGAAGGATTDAAFDPKTATEVPKGVEPEAYVQAYYEACDKGDWQAAFDALPTAKKAGNSPEALKEQVSGYGVKEFKVTAATAEGDKAIVKVDQVTGSYGTFENTWTFVKGDNGTWLVESKAVTGMK